MCLTGISILLQVRLTNTPVCMNADSPTNTAKSEVSFSTPVVGGAAAGAAVIALVIIVAVVVLRSRRARKVEPNGSRTVLAV